jgi:hypothetical protein
MQCRHKQYFKLAVSCDGVQLPNGGNVPAAVDTTEEVQAALDTVKDFSADLRTRRQAGHV